MTLLYKLAERVRTLSDWLEKLAHVQHRRFVRPSEANLDEYVVEMPTRVNAINILPGWNQPLPPDFDGVSNPGGLFDDARIHWAIEQFGGIAGANILELGPLEGAHTYMLEKAGANSIMSVEANKLSYLRSLIVKEVMHLTRSWLLLGDFQEWLQNNSTRYDFVIASGVLYHMQDPLALLERIAARTDAFYIWTHYVSDEAMPRSDIRRKAFLGGEETVMFHGIPVRLYRRSYHGAWRSKSFCGGTHDTHRWVEREDLLSAIRALGFDDVRVSHDEWDRPNGPSFSIFGRRTPRVVNPSEGSQS